MNNKEKLQRLIREVEIAEQYLPFEVHVSVREQGYTDMVYPNLLGKTSKEDVANFMLTYPPSGEKISTEHKGSIYDFIYKFDVSSDPNGSKCNLMYLDGKGNEIYLNLPIKWIEEFITYEMRPVVDTELHYFGGVCRDKIGKIRNVEFKGKSLSWYGGHKTLICEETIDKIIKTLTNEK